MQVVWEGEVMLKRQQLQTEMATYEAELKTKKHQLLYLKTIASVSLEEEWQSVLLNTSREPILLYTVLVSPVLLYSHVAPAPLPQDHRLGEASGIEGDGTMASAR
jgi:hypothetical protein